MNRRYIALAAAAALFALAACGSRDAERASSEAASLADATTAVGPAEPASGEARAVTTPPPGQDPEKAPR